MKIEMTFPGGLAVDAKVKGHTVSTDQPAAAGGGGGAPAPFDLFLASIGTCAGFYALRFCQERSLPTEGLGLELLTETDPATHRVEAVRLELQLPASFPEKYRSAIARAMDQCAVKRHIMDPPRFEISAIAAEQPAFVS